MCVASRLQGSIGRPAAAAGGDKPARLVAVVRREAGRGHGALRVLVANRGGDRRDADLAVTFVELAAPVGFFGLALFIAVFVQLILP